jgi:hypothetical protein
VQITDGIALQTLGPAPASSTSDIKAVLVTLRLSRTNNAQSRKNGAGGDCPTNL